MRKLTLTLIALILVASLTDAQFKRRRPPSTWTETVVVPDIALDAMTDSCNHGGAITTWAVPHTVGASANLLMVYLNVYRGAELTVDSVKWADQKATMVADTGGGASVYLSALFYLLNPTPGADTVIAYLSANGATEWAIGITSWENVNTSTPLGAYSAFYSEAAIDTIPTTVSAAVGDVVYSGVAYYAGNDVKNYGTGQTELWHTTYAAGYAMTAGSWKAGAASVDLVTRLNTTNNLVSGISVALKHQ